MTDQRKLIAVIIHGDTFGEILPVDVQALEAATETAKGEYEKFTLKLLKRQESIDEDGEKVFAYKYEVIPE